MRRNPPRPPVSRWLTVVLALCITTLPLLACEEDDRAALEERGNRVIDEGKEVGKTAVSKGQDELEEWLAGPWGVRFEYPLLNNPAEKRAQGFDNPNLDTADRGDDGWSTQQAFNSFNNQFSVCATAAAPDCYHAGVDLQADGDWTANGVNSIGQPVYPIADGVIVELHRTGRYPGSAILIEHETKQGKLYSMYGHINVAENIGYGPISQATKIGTIFSWNAEHGAKNSHLHFEVRTFRDAISFSKAGAPFDCGCIVGPGYWLASRGGVASPVGAPPGTGWLNPIREIEESRQWR